MSTAKAYTGKTLVEAYDYRHFGGTSGQYILGQDRKALESLLGSARGLLLDIPCGTGAYAAEFMRNGYELIAGDASLPMLKEAGQRQAGMRRVLCDIHHLPFKAAAFDAVVTVRLFQHYPGEDLRRILHELRRAIKPGGHAIFDTFRWTPRRVPLLRRFLDRGDMYVLPRRRVEEMIQTAGLRKVKEISLHLFSPIWQRKLPLWFLRGLTALESILPRRWLLRTFWACTRD